MLLFFILKKSYTVYLLEHKLQTMFYAPIKMLIFSALGFFIASFQTLKKMANYFS